MRALPVVLALAIVAAPLAAARAHSGNPISTSMKIGWDRAKKQLVASAELMPAADYNFKPTPEVRSFGQVIGHAADAMVMFCSAYKGEKAPNKDVEKNATTKEALKKGLAEAVAYCDAVYGSLDDATLVQPLELFGQKMIKFTALDINLGHSMEHYGNLVVYLRLKKLTPPSSQKQKE
jgi:uncharacterized damage-inducible protein DinB